MLSRKLHGYIDIMPVAEVKKHVYTTPLNNAYEYPSNPQLNYEGHSQEWWDQFQYGAHALYKPHKLHVQGACGDML